MKLYEKALELYKEIDKGLLKAEKIGLLDTEEYAKKINEILGVRATCSWLDLIQKFLREDWKLDQD